MINASPAKLYFYATSASGRVARHLHGTEPCSNPLAARNAALCVRRSIIRALERLTAVPARSAMRETFDFTERDAFYLARLRAALRIIECAILRWRDCGLPARLSDGDFVAVEVR